MSAPTGAARVLVSGAGIAGPALAHLLHRGGAEVTVVERAAAPRPGGQAVDLRGAARDAVARMGLLEQVRAASLRTPAFVSVDAEGRPLARTLAEPDGQLAEIEILRGELSRVLRTPGPRYRFGDRITALHQDPAGVDVTFADAAPARFDAVVGADGMHSGVRALLVGDARRHVHHLGVTVAYWSAPNHLGLGEDAVEHSDGGREVGVRPIPGTGRMIAYIAAPAPAADPSSSVAEQKALVRGLAAGMGWVVPRLLADLDAADDLYLDSCSQVRLDHWSSGRVVLLGDAAFSPSPLTGQGTSLALVAAYVLAEALLADPATAGAAYERSLRPWVERTQALAGDPSGIAEVANAFRIMDP